MKAELLKKIDELENDFRSDYALKENGYNEALEDVRQVIQSLQQSDWISVEDRLPTREEYGEKVLIYREMNDSQKLLAYSVHDTSMIKYCDKDTFWKPLTPPNR
jgi:hypothetical protein